MKLVPLNVLESLINFVPSDGKSWSRAYVRSNRNNFVVVVVDCHRQAHKVTFLSFVLPQCSNLNGVYTNLS
jgi:hypothetical protein